jgi:hypothetical protein
MNISTFKWKRGIMVLLVSYHLKINVFYTNVFGSARLIFKKKRSR